MNTKQKKVEYIFVGEDGKEYPAWAWIEDAHVKSIYKDGDVCIPTDEYWDDERIIDTFGGLTSLRIHLFLERIVKPFFEDTELYHSDHVYVFDRLKIRQQAADGYVYLKSPNWEKDGIEYSVDLDTMELEM